MVRMERGIEGGGGEESACFAEDFMGGVGNFSKNCASV